MAKYVLLLRKQNQIVPRPRLSENHLVAKKVVSSQDHSNLQKLRQKRLLRQEIPMKQRPLKKK